MLFVRRRFSEAEIYQALKLNPNGLKYPIQLSAVLMYQEKVTESLDILEQGLELDPTYEECLINKAFALSKLERSEEAYQIVMIV